MLPSRAGLMPVSALRYDLYEVNKAFAGSHCEQELKAVHATGHTTQLIEDKTNLSVVQNWIFFFRETKGNRRLAFKYESELVCQAPFIVFMAFLVRYPQMFLISRFWGCWKCL